MDYEARAVAAARVASLLVIAVGLAILAGWYFHEQGLKALYLPGPTVKTNAALCLAIAALANLILISARERRSWRALGIVSACVPMVIGALTLSQHVAGWDLGIDQMLASEPPGALGTASPNRMGPPASTTFVLLGLAMLMGESRSARRRWLGQAIALTACAIPVLPLLGYAYGYSQLYALARYTGIALSTALGLLVLGLAVLAGRPRQGFAALLCRADEVGTLGRRLLPPAILLPFGLGWLMAHLLRAKIIDGAFAISAMSLVLLAGMATLIWRTGRRLAASLDARLAAERELSEKARALREADAQKSEFMATLSHELRNPLAPIRFALDLLDSPPPTGERARITIRRQVQHLTRLIDDLLDLTRITRNKLQLQLKPVALADAITDALDATAGELARGGQRLALAVPETPLWLHADADRVVQILTNLLNNAVRHTDAKGTITLGATDDTTHVTIYVRDTGAGIQASNLERVFDSFVQVGESRHGGLGIGLALVKGLAELHGGAVQALSEGLGRGSEFRVRLPRADAPAAAAENPAQAPPAPRQRVLVVDDNRDAADLLGNLLADLGHDVLVAYDGADALRRAPAFDPAIALLDIGMPGMNGYELAAELRRTPSTAGMLLIAITGWGQDEDRRRAFASGFDAHLTKPADLDRITALIAEHRPAEAPRP